jgi:uncharacterized protein YbaR (Trm112 family)
LSQPDERETLARGAFANAVREGENSALSLDEDAESLRCRGCGAVYRVSGGVPDFFEVPEAGR